MNRIDEINKKIKKLYKTYMSDKTLIDDTKYIDEMIELEKEKLELIKNGNDNKH